MLIIESLDKKYPTGDRALKSVSLSVQTGEVIGLIGPSGAGKSSLIRCVNRLIEPSGGSITLNGKNILAMGQHQLRLARREIGMIFQEFALVERLTVMENLLSGRLGYTGFWASWFRRFNQADIARAFELLDRVGLSGMHNKRADELSGGQRQRVGIARALMQSPTLLLVDEPTASLDPKTSRQIMRLIIDLCRERGLAAIINIHDVVLATEYLPRIVGLRAGEIVFDGQAQSVDQTVLSRIYGEEDWTALTRKVQQAASSGAETDSDSDTVADPVRLYQ
ncbi:MAG: phosphonate ABC transporter ATP-binding protein [Orrella sp.]|uniref:phosphonate ABC transporter ATP-binding protein n=1 Tax=Orrella sp. TaxID=1921583 RepID=UPI003BCFEEC9